MGEKEQQYGLLISFEDQSPSFVHGFEAGQIWEAMQDEKPEIGKIVHTANMDLISQMAARAGYVIELTSSGMDEWTNLRAYRRPQGVDHG